MLPAETLAEIDLLLARVRAAEPLAMDALITKSLPFIRKYIASVGSGIEPSDPSADVVLDAAAKVARKFSLFRGETAISYLSWLKKVVVRTLFDAQRRKRRKERKPSVSPEGRPAELLSGEEAWPRAQRPNDRMDAIDTWLMILAALLELPSRQRQAFWLCCICERTQEEAAAKLGRSRPSIAGDVNRAREALESVLRSTEKSGSYIASNEAPAKPTAGLPLEAFLLAGRFEMGPLVSEGVVSQIYGALDRATGQAVAVSMLNYEHCSSAESVARFINESSWLRSIIDAHISTVLAGGMLRGGRPYLVQEWLPVSLADVLKQGPASPAGARAVVLQVVRAISALHAIGLMHRNINPSCFRMSRWDLTNATDSPPPIKLTSLRLAKPTRTRRAETPLPISTIGTLLPGALEYRAPELWLDSKQADERADVYSIGVLWYALLTGRPPIQLSEGETTETFMQRCLHAELLREQLTQGEPLLSRMLSKVPSERPTLAAVCDALAGE